jgi:hypothetical protein
MNVGPYDSTNNHTSEPVMAKPKRPSQDINVSALHVLAKLCLK